MKTFVPMDRTQKEHSFGRHMKESKTMIENSTYKVLAWRSSIVCSLVNKHSQATYSLVGLTTCGFVMPI